MLLKNEVILFPPENPLYPILSLPSDDVESYVNAFDALVRAGVAIVQLRAKGLRPGDLEQLAGRLVKRARAARIRLILNDEVELAARIRADGVHVGQKDASVKTVRGLGIPLVGVSTHSVEEARNAQSQGADYIGVGCLFPSPTEPHRKPLGLATLRRIRAQVHIPIVAVGGISHDNIWECVQAGADAVSSISAVFGGGDFESNCRNLMARIHAEVLNT
ncbi:MAG: thiamine phosphate synthase [Candidatus Omnitrophica bacterium]|nr:thiamine phosphate synthase [Candidatus Omnitrophota bacterium]